MKSLRERVFISYSNLLEIRNILLGYYQTIIVFTDHKNNTFNWLQGSYHVLRWLLLLEEYGVAFEYLSGKKNVATIADSLSRLDIDSLKIQDDTERALTLILWSKTAAQVISK
jgi:hypothetical protein